MNQAITARESLMCTPLRIRRCFLRAFLGAAPAFAVFPLAAVAQQTDGQALPPRIHSAAQATSSGVGFQLFDSPQPPPQPPRQSPLPLAELPAPIVAEVPEDFVIQFEATAPEARLRSEATVTSSPAAASANRPPANRPPANRAMQLLAQPREQVAFLPNDRELGPVQSNRIEAPAELAQVSPAAWTQEPDEAAPAAPAPAQEELPRPRQNRQPSGLSDIRFVDRAASHPAADMSEAYPELVSIPASEPTAAPISPRTVEWAASNLRYRRPYFEQVMLERHGLSRRPGVQTVYSAGRFFTTATFLPVIMWMRPSCDLFDHRALGHSGSPLDIGGAPTPASLQPSYVPESPAEILSRPAPAEPIIELSAPDVESESLEVIESLEAIEPPVMRGELAIPPPEQFDPASDWID